jgi:hypothetical protein
MLGQKGLACWTYDLVVGDGDDIGLRHERRADIAVFPIRREDRHARAVRNNDPRLFLVGRTVEHTLPPEPSSTLTLSLPVPEGRLSWLAS